MAEEPDFEVLDVEDYRAEKNNEFSHQGLVMAAMRKVIEYGCQELIQGYYSTEPDPKTGKTKVIYKQDTRKAFIESVRTLRMIMICDFDKDATDKLIAMKTKAEKVEGNVMDKLNEQKTKYMGEQKKWWDSLSDGQRSQAERAGMSVIDRYFNTNLPFYNQYFLEELEIYREIFEELTMLTKRKDFYKAERYEG